MKADHGGHYEQKKSSYVHDRDYSQASSASRDSGASRGDLQGRHYGAGNKAMTDDPTGDGPLVWISAYPKSRVVSIQTGHNRESHYDPVFRRLVHNAIAWSGGR